MADGGGMDWAGVGRIAGRRGADLGLHGGDQAVQVDQRSSLDSAMARAAMASRAGGRPGTRTETGGGGSRRWAKTTSMSFMRSNGTEPVRQWNRTQPSE